MNTQKGFSTIAGIIITLLIIIIGGGLYYLNSEDEKKEREFNNEIIENREDESNLDFDKENKIADDISKEIFKNQPGVVFSIEEVNEQEYLLAVDILTYNPEWRPGNGESRTINQNPRLRDLYLTKETEIVGCGFGQSSFDSLESVVESIKKVLNRYEIENYAGGWFMEIDAEGNKITFLYEQCAN